MGGPECRGEPGCGGAGHPRRIPIGRQGSGTGPLARYDDNRNGRIACKEARRHGIAPVPRSHPFVGIVTKEERLEIMKRHPLPWPHVPFDPAKIPPEVMEKILCAGTSPQSAESPSSRRRRRPP